ncbi:hypothetical protein COO60DRAFT_1632245 [Scenedesmus sp. NREL 46B-D3]|nr:hypothetical protein COO60DRAFT_1632245 [Scenedesmus sp. NREL 46B-D3]
MLAYDERSVAGSSRRSTGAAVAAAGDGSKAVGSSAASTKKQAGAIPHKVVLLHGYIYIGNVILIWVLLSLCCCQRLQQHIPVYWYL